MNSLPKDVKQLIYWHVWKLKLNDCHREIINKKIEVVDKIMLYHNSPCSFLSWKKKRFDFEREMCRNLYAKMISSVQLYVEIEVIHVYGEPEDDLQQWSDNAYKTFKNIHETRVWHEIPEKK